MRRPSARSSARREHLEQIDRCRVGDDRPRWNGDDSGDLVAELRRACRSGPGRVPAPDEPFAPLALDDAGDGGGGRFRQRPRELPSR